MGLLKPPLCPQAHDPHQEPWMGTGKGCERAWLALQRGGMPWMGQEWGQKG